MSNAAYSLAPCKPSKLYTSTQAQWYSLSVSHTHSHTHAHSVVEVCNLITVLGEGWPRAPATRFTHGILGGRAQLRRTMKLPLTFIHLTQLTLSLSLLSLLLVPASLRLSFSIFFPPAPCSVHLPLLFLIFLSFLPLSIFAPLLPHNPVPHSAFHYQCFQQERIDYRKM